MIERKYTKLCNSGRLTQELIDAGLPLSPTTDFVFYGVITNNSAAGDETIIILIDDVTQDDLDTCDAVVAAHIPTPLPPEPPDPIPVDLNDVQKDESGKMYVRAETRPINCTTLFTSKGDTLGDPPSIGTGTEITWDASKSGEFTSDGAPSGFKQKIIDLVFCDSIYITAGACFFTNALRGSSLDMMVVVPDNQDGHTIMDHFVNHWPMTGTCQGGSTIDSATISSELPAGTILRFIIIVPESDNVSNGDAVIKMYRTRTVVHSS